MRKTAEFLLDMLYPKKCPLCHEVLKVIILQKEEVFSPMERYGGSLWYVLSITDAGNMEIFTQKP